ncbi:MAG: cysteine synthase family protein [Candidatus Peregrinibacteria bacterium]
MIGGTPLLELPVRNPNWQLYLKMEKTNPGQSMKDRMALSMINGAEQRGNLKPGGTIIESSSGNTAIGLAMIAAARGYRFIAVVDHHAAKEKINIIRAYGGEVVYVGEGHAPDKVAVKEREEMAARLASEIPNSFFPNQADNPDNPVGYGSLAQEIIEALVNVRILIGSIGTGGSLCGTARALKKNDSSIKVAAVEPKGSVIFGGPDGPYFQSGTGNPGSVEIAGNVDRSVIDENHWASDKEAFNTARFLAKSKGILVGGSAGGVVYKALELTHSREGGGNMVALIPDGGERYISTLFNDDWMHTKQLLDISVETHLRILMKLEHDR